MEYVTKHTKIINRWLWFLSLFVCCCCCCVSVCLGLFVILWDFCGVLLSGKRLVCITIQERTVEIVAE